MDVYKKIYDVSWGFGPSAVFTGAAKVGIFRLLKDAKNSLTVVQVSNKLKLNSDACRKILNALTAMSFVAKKSNKYKLNNDFKSFVNKNDGIFDWIEHSHGLALKWHLNMEGYLQTGAIERRERDKESQKQFLGAMRFNSKINSKKFVKCINLKDVKEMVDLGGGPATFSIELAKKNKHLKAYVVDLPESKIVAEEAIKEANLKDRVKFVSSNYFDIKFNEKFDFVLISNVVHQEKEEGAIKLLKKAYEILKKNGKVCVLDFAIDETGTKPLFGALFAINMFDFGDTYSFSTIKGWLKIAGFKSIERRFLDSQRWTIIGHK